MWHKFTFPWLLCIVHVAMVSSTLPHSYGRASTDQQEENTVSEQRNSKINVLEYLMSQLESNMESDVQGANTAWASSLDSEDQPHYDMNDLMIGNIQSDQRQASINSRALADLIGSTNSLGYRLDTPQANGDVSKALNMKRGHNPYRYSFQSSCDTTRLTREHLLEYFRTGRLCGRRVSQVRFGLSGRK